jgi:hypothetical protein
MQTSTEIVLQLIISLSSIKNIIFILTKVKTKLPGQQGKTNNSDDKVSAYSSWYIIANADDRNVLPTEQTSAYPGTYATHLATKTKPMTILIKIDYCVIHRFEPVIVSAMEKCHWPHVTPP